jgi:hypothetical protein
MVLWGLLFTEFWRRKERELAIWWGTRNFSRFEQRRPEFHEEKYVKNAITGEMEPFFPPWKRWLRRAIAAPVILTCSIALSFVLLAYILFEVIMSEYYSGPFREQMVRCMHFVSYLLTRCVRALIRILSVIDLSADHNVLRIRAWSEYGVCATCASSQRI